MVAQDANADTDEQLDDVPLGHLVELAEATARALAARVSGTQVVHELAPMASTPRQQDWSSMLQRVAEPPCAEHGDGVEAHADTGAAADAETSAQSGQRPDAITLPDLNQAVEQVGRAIVAAQTAIARHTSRAFTVTFDREQLLGLPEGKTAFRDTEDYLVRLLRVSRHDAKRRLKWAGALLPDESVSGQPVEPRFPDLADALWERAMDGASVEHIVTTLVTAQGIGARSNMDHDQVEKLLADGERTLVEQGRTLEPDTLRKTAAHWLRMFEALVDPDGAEPTDQHRAQQQGLFHRGTRHGLHHWTLVATDVQHEILMTVASSATNPRSSAGWEAVLGAEEERAVLEDQATADAVTGSDHGGDDAETNAVNAADDDTDDANATDDPSQDGTAEAGPTSTAPEQNAGDQPVTQGELPLTAGETQLVSAPAVDPRSRAQKQLDGLIACLSGGLAVADTSTLPASGGVRPQVAVTIDHRTLLKQLADAAEAAPTESGTTESLTGTFRSTATFTGPVRPDTIRALACDAEILPVVLGDHGEVLDLGRSRRLFTPKLRRAIAARDGGCSAPGCSIPAPWCDAHHVEEWEHGGFTSVDNGVLLCNHHHHAVHAGAWSISMSTGRPWFIPAPYLDPRQRPQRNRYWRQ